MCGCKGKCGCNITSTTKGEKGDASPVASLGYKVYTALLNQSGTNDPTAIVLQNTLGGTPIWTRNAAGDYRMTLASTFTTDKTFILLLPSYDAGIDLLCGSFRLSANVIQVTSANVISSVLADDLMNNISIEVRVYS